MERLVLRGKEKDNFFYRRRIQNKSHRQHRDSRHNGKNIVDILVEAHDPAAMEKAAKAIEQNGYIKMSEGNNRKSFNRGYTVHGFAEKVFHLHLRLYGDNNELYFRDYLIEHAGIAREYEKLKLSLWKKHEFNRDAYTAAKPSLCLNTRF